MPRSFVIGSLAGLAAAAVLAVTGEARAGFFLGAELDGGTPIDSPYSTGLGIVGSLGYRIGLGPVFLQPEAQGSYMTFPGTAVAGHATRITGGGRLGLGRMVQPTLFGHVGIGWVDVSRGINGPAADVGFALGFKLIPYLRFGLQAAYNVVTIVNSPATLKWISYGAHVGIEF
jgi:hypothetical protein